MIPRLFRMTLLLTIVAPTMFALSGAAPQVIKSTNIDPVRKGAAISIACQLNFRYDRARVWQVLVTMKGIETMTGFKINADEGPKEFAKAGDAVAAMYGEQTGRLIVTGFDARRELRLSFETEDHALLHTRRFLLATAGEGCVVQYRVQYTDYSEHADETAAKLRDEIAPMVTEFRKIAEPRPMPTRQR